LHWHYNGVLPGRTIVRIIGECGILGTVCGGCEAPPNSALVRFLPDSEPSPGHANHARKGSRAAEGIGSLECPLFIASRPSLFGCDIAGVAMALEKNVPWGRRLIRPLGIGLLASSGIVVAENAWRWPL
jgi:hypothetical protein